jgi:cytochrome c-type biogenesis protein CcmH
LAAAQVTALVLLLLAVAAPVRAAVDPGEVLGDPAREARARAITRQLRCLVCQNQSIDDSNAPLARDLRRVVRERIVAGADDSEVIDYVVARYGDFVLLRPPVKPETWLLWFGPGVLALAGAVFLLVRSRRQNAQLSVAPLTPGEQARARAMLEGRDQP